MLVSSSTEITFFKSKFQYQNYGLLFYMYSEYVNPYITTPPSPTPYPFPPKKDQSGHMQSPYKLIAHFTLGPVFTLVICKQRKRGGYPLETIFLQRPDITKQQSKLNCLPHE